ncbi:pentatricopeptide repeat-containing protein [Tripterygium wilfordii]|uniref:Pentatricopeptide repeat-containing protein n=1 Tax=Tripterygium wilfordii TaxID=458696 RepID=A0A7J7DMR2_TRIWF|nr:pentatricopeptide repeat-containing protein At2g38420, mitochondrial [Tripterygium wilfordii]KAF5747660.1 pentatricopeptide repeat-containing protein [Tripterygium wilfordii]
MRHRLNLSPIGFNMVKSFFLRKHRKWPIVPSKLNCQAFNQQQALQTLKRAASESHQQQANPEKPHLLSALLDSFKIHNSTATPEAYHFVFKTLINTSQSHHIPSVLTHLEKFEKFETPEDIFTDVFKFYAETRRVRDAIDLFYRVPKLRCVPSVYTLNALLSVLCRDKEGLKMVPSILLKSQFMNIRVDESSFCILMKALCKIRKVGYAIQILNCMTNYGYVVDAKMLSLILSSMCQQRDLTSLELMEFFEGLRKLGFCPGMADYTNVISFLVKEVEGMDALDVLNRMKSDGIKPDIVCYTMVLDGVIAEGDYVKADNLFDELLVLGLVPDAYTYNVYIKGLCMQNKIEAGIKMISCMEKLGCKANLITYNMLLKELYKDRKLSRANELVREMRSKGIGVNLQTYRIMIDGLIAEGDVNEPCKLLEEALVESFDFQGSTLDVIVCELCQRGLACKALELVKIMVPKNVSPGVRGWETLLLSFGSELTYGEATWIALVNPS